MMQKREKNENDERERTNEKLKKISVLGVSKGRPIQK